MDSYRRVSRRRLTRDHLKGTPLGEIIPKEAESKLLAVADSPRGNAQALLVDQVPVGYIFVSDDLEFMMHVHPSFAGRGIGTGVLTGLVQNARQNRQRLWAKVRQGSAGERLARRAGMVEKAIVDNEVFFEAFEPESPDS